MAETDVGGLAGKFYSNQERKGIKRIDKLRSIIKVINQYGKSTRMGDIDKKWALGFIDWLQHTYKGRQEKLLEQGTVVAYISQLSIALNAAVRAEWLGENPFMLLSASERVKKPESKRQFLAIEEVKLLIATECRNRTVKQAYLFSCYCGLRLSDMETLCWKDIICNDGRYMIATVQQKTSTPIIRRSRKMQSSGCLSGKRTTVTRRLFSRNFRHARPPTKSSNNGWRRPVSTRKSPTTQAAIPSER